MILLDTAAWIWRASDPARLSPAVRDAIERADRVLVSAISAWEVAMLVATALEHAVPIATPDERIRTYPHVQSVW